ncbi:MAG: tetratricopeptide repeat protein [Desulfobacterales bacterium]
MKNDALIVKHAPEKAGADMLGAKSDFRKVFLVSLCLVAAVIVTYIPVIHSDFVGYDDELYVAENKQVQEGFTSESLKWVFTTFHSANWHPLTWLSHMLDCELYGLNPAGHHWTQVEFHIVNTVLLFLILFKMTGALFKSAFVAALFALHPLHVESVAWVSERKDLLSTFFGLMMIFAYHRYVKSSVLKNYLLIIIFLSLGLMAKPMLVTFPFVLLLLDFWPLKRFQYKKNENDDLLQPERKIYYGFKGLMRLILEKIPLFIPVVISSILTFLAQKSEGAIKTLGALSLKTRIANALVSFVSYVSKAIWPSKLAVFYPHHRDALSGWTIIGAALVIAAAILLSIRSLKKYPYIAVGLFWYLGTLVPVIGLVQVGDQAMADRYTYIPLIGLFIIVAWGVSDLFKKWQYGKTFIGVYSMIILSALAWKTFHQLGYWKNGITLFENAVKVTENNYNAQNNLGTAYCPVDLDKAIYHYKAALKINSNFILALYNLGTALSEKKDYENAVYYFNKALKINPKRTDVRMNLANVLFIKGKADEAVSHYIEILKTDSENADAHYNLGYVLSTQRNFKEAVFHYRQALRINPEYVKAHYFIGNILLKQGKTEEAFTHFSQAIKMDPDYVQAYNKVGLILFKQGKLDRAKVFFSKAIQIDPNYKEARKNLGIANQALKPAKP